MRFEYDPAKSVANKAKHGIDFEEIQKMRGGAVVAVVSHVQTGEDRWLNMGTIDGKHWTVVTCARGEMTRIISARRSGRDEERYYEEHIC